MHFLFITSLSLAVTAVAARVTPASAPDKIYEAPSWDTSDAIISGNSSYQSLKLTCPGLSSKPEANGPGSDCLQLNFAVDEAANRVLINGVEVFPKMANPAERIEAMDSHQPPCKHSVGYVLEMLHVSSTNFERSPGFIEMSLKIVDIDSVGVHAVPDVSTIIAMDHNGGLSLSRFEIKAHGTTSIMERLCDMISAAKSKMQCCAQYYIHLMAHAVSNSSANGLIATGTGMTLIGLVLVWILTRRRVDLPVLSRGCFFKRFSLKSHARGCSTEKMIEEQASLMSNQEAHSPSMPVYRDHCRGDC